MVDWADYTVSIDRGKVVTFWMPDADPRARLMLAADIARVYDDRIGNTLTVWFGNPEDEVEETGEEVILMKDKSGRVIGFEKLNFLPTQPMPFHVAFETIAV